MKPWALAWLTCVLVASVAAPPAAADDIVVEQPTLEATEDGHVLAANFRFELGPRLIEAIDNGVPLVFVVEFELSRPRWYWFDERTLQRTLRQRLSFNALTRQYRLSSGALHQSFPTLGEALRVLAHMRGWLVIEKGQAQPEATYDAWVRMRLDHAQLPKPFQVSAFTSRDWTLASPWTQWKFTPNAVARPQPAVEAAK